MTTVNITCAGPGPHIPANGILGSSDTPQTAAMYCPAAPCQAALAALNAPAQQLAANAVTIQANLATLTKWIDANPSGAVLTAAQTLVLAKIIRALTLAELQQFTTTAGT